MRIYRLHLNKKWPAHINRDGMYVLGDPVHGSQKHHARNKVFVATEEEAISKIRKGHSIWVKSPTAPALARDNLFIDGEKYT